jgi:CheY-like chemotaxis protein
MTGCARPAMVVAVGILSTTPASLRQERVRGDRRPVAGDRKVSHHAGASRSGAWPREPCRPRVCPVCSRGQQHSAAKPPAADNRGAASTPWPSAKDPQRLVIVEAGAAAPGIRTLAQAETGISNGGQLLLILTSRDVQSVADLALASGRNSTDTLRSLGRLVDQGFLVVADQSGTAVYQLRPRAEQGGVADLPEHVLLIEDDVMIGEVVVAVLEDEGYAVIACLTPLQGVALLQRITFDLVITDGFSRVPGAVLVNTADVVRSAGVTPVALFSAHTLDVELARAAGFRDLITKPFDMDTLVRQVKALLGELPRYAAPDPSSGGAPFRLPPARHLRYGVS